MKKIAILALSFCFLLNNAFAQPKHRGQHGNHLSKEAKTELQKFQKETVYPVKKAEHDKFLSSLNQEDLAFLEAKRKEGKALQEEMKALRQKMQAERKSGKSKEEMHAEMKAAFAPMKEKRQAFMQSMKPFMEHNQVAIKASMDVLKTKHESWMVERKAIVEKYLTAEQKEKMQAHKAEMDKKRSEHPERAEKHGKHGQMMHAVRFVLWDGTFNELEEGEHAGHHHHRHHGDKKDCDKDGKKGQAASKKESTNTLETVKSEKVLNLNSYPNPAISQTTIMFELPNEATKATLILTDAQGKQVWKKTYNKLEAGENKLDVDLHKFSNGQYFYTLEIDGTQTTKSLIISK